MTVYRFLIGILLLLFIGVSTPMFAANPTLPADGLIVKFRAATSQSSRIHALSTAGLTKVEAFSLVPGLTHVRTVAGETIQSSLAAIQNNPNVEYVEPNYYVNALAVPTDPEFAKQYGLQNTGQTGGVAGADVDAVNAWDLQTGNNVVIAVIDTGVEYTHPELENNIWTNSAEIPANGIDDDANGFIDDVYGWDFSNDDNDPLDDMGHGTHVAGIIAANTNNGAGIAGINWRAKIMSLKFIDAAGIGTTSNAIKALNYAVLMGAKISNNSWGGGAYTQGLYDTLAAANAAGHLFVAASGNNGLNTDDPVNSMHYPSSYDLVNVISVAATDEFDNLGTFSNYGAVSVDLAAPGKQILSLWINNSYLSLDGTSMAAPFVAGAAGLLLSSMPGLTIPQLRAALLDNVDPLPSLAGLMVTGGRLNLYNALSSITANISVTPTTQHIGVNETLAFFASGGTLPYQWSVTNSSVAQIDAATGLLQGLRPGTTQVTVQDANGFSKRSGDIIVDQLFMNPETAILNVGQTIQMTVNGGVAPYSWSSSNSNAFQIDPFSGVLTALAAGQGFVMVTDSNGLMLQSGLIEVIFVPDLVLSAPNGPLMVGDVFKFQAQGGVPPYTYGSLDTSLATIDPVNGTMKALRSGIAQIFVEDASGLRVTHNDILIEDVQVLTEVNSMQINESQSLNVIGGSPPFEWRVTNSRVATVDNNGLLTAIGPGSIKVTVMDSEGNLAATDVITISESTLLSVTTASSILALNQQVAIRASGGVPPYEWSVSNSAVLLVDPIGFTVSAKGVGVAHITVTDAVGNSASSPVIEVRNIVIFPQTTQLQVNEKVQFSATGGIEPYKWSVDNISVASIDFTGMLTAKISGIVTVLVEDADGVKSKSERIAISSGGSALPLFEITPRTAILSKRSSNGLTFTATGGVPPYTYSLSSPVGSINSVTGEYSPLSPTGGNTTVIVTDSQGNVRESGIISVR